MLKLNPPLNKISKGSLFLIKIRGGGGGLLPFDVAKVHAQNGQIQSLAKIFSNLSLFSKYFGEYHYFETRVSKTRVL